MEQRFLIDSNVVIDALGNAMPEGVKRIISGMPPIVSAVIYMEALGWHKADASQLTALRKFMSIAVILPFLIAHPGLWLPFRNPCAVV
jgi:hypothetical protein